MKSHATRIDMAIRELTRAKAAIEGRNFSDAAASVWIAVEACSSVLNRLEDTHNIDGESLSLARKRPA